MASKFSKIPFVPADIVADVPGGATTSYAVGFNCSGTSQQEVLLIVKRADGSESTYAVLRGVSRTKAAAIAMILNSPDEA